MKKNLRAIAMTLIATLALAGLTACGSANTNVESNGNKVDTVVNEIKNDDVVVSGNIGAATDVKVAELEEDSVEYVALASYLADKATNYATYNITITKDGAAVQPDGKVEVTIKLSDEMLAAAGNAYSVLYVNGAEVTKLDCTEKDGYITFATDHFSIYTVVKYEASEEVESEIEALPTETPTPIPVHKHDYTEVEGSAVEATCTTDGKKADKVCECGDKVEGEVVKATGHNYGEYKSDDNASYDADGTKTATCDTCGAKDTVTDKGSKLERPKYTYTDMNKTMYAKSSVNVRDLPSTDGNKLGGLSSGQEVKVTGKCNETGWFRIDYNGKVAYVSNSYLQDNKPVAETPTPEPTPSNPSDNSEILNSAWYLGADGVYHTTPYYNLASSNITSEWVGKTLSEYCSAKGVGGISINGPFYNTIFLRASEYGDYVIGSHWIANITYQGREVEIQLPI